MKSLSAGRLIVALTIFAAAFSQSAARAQSPAVADEVSGWYEKDRIYVHLSFVNDVKPDAIDDYIQRTTGGAPRPGLYGERWGNPVGTVLPLRVRIFVVEPKPGQKPIQLDLSSLKEAPPRLTIEPQQNGDNWQVAYDRAVKGYVPLSVVTVPCPLTWAGRSFSTQLTQVNVLVQTFKDPRQRIPLWLEFKYTANDLPEGGPEWKAVTTPSWVVDMSTLADPGDDLPLGNSNLAVQKRPLLLGWTLIAVALIAYFFVLVRRGSRFLRRRFPQERPLDAREGLWHLLRPMLERTKTESGYALSLADVDSLLKAVAEFVSSGREGVDVRTWSIDELDEKRYEYADGDRWCHVLKPLKAVQQQLCKPLTDQGYAAIVERIAQLCPEE